MKNITSSSTCGSGLLQLQNNLSNSATNTSTIVGGSVIDDEDAILHESKQKDGIVGPGTITSPWPPMGAGPPGALGPADTNGSMVDSKNLDVGDMSDDEKDLSSADAEGVWSPDIEQSFQEALSIYPPCGRRKIILSDEGKMYGRNELIARYIKLRTGKTRTRKQVSSHIQVLARRKLREIQAKIKVQFWQPGLQPSTSQDFYDYSIKPFAQPPYPAGKPSTAVSGDIEAGLPPAQLPWEGRAIATHKFRLLEFSAFMEIQREEIYHRHLFVQLGGKPSFSDPLLETVDIRQISDKFPEKSGGLKDLYEKGPQNAFYLVKCWADLNTGRETGDFYGVTSQYESNENVVLVCSTKVCSFGKQVVEKVETEYSRLENGRFVYRIHRSPMCEYMINFIQKLKDLPERYMMNSVLENFTILQVMQARDTQETLLCIAYVFEVAEQNSGATHHIYRLIKE
ncbi:protein scalloped isoform X5 [Bactrocera neohumeralis]|uniref:Protein scalloped isoform X7 n=5 Tax=Dacini TaxID=43871 RepID=A0ABM3JQT6_BACDO|nr:protein scalloped isoform X2 [Bactrocera tryoni]XP_049311602.1 protein scalloped isoform X7 [Bactrocera dorsalis]XP_050330657.1 protein scalloped isoform X5 [Bactrocera neohumeralis]